MNSDERHSRIYEDEIDLGKYFQVIWKRRMSVLIFTLVCAVSAGIISFLLPKAYQSELLLRIGNIGNVGNSGNVGNGMNVLHVGNVCSTAIENEAMVVELIKSKSFLSTVINKYLKKMGGRDIDPKGMNVKATFEKGKSTQMIKIQAEGRSPQQAVETVNAIANEVIIRHKDKFDNAVSIIKNIEEDLNTQIRLSKKQIEEMRKIMTKVERDPKVDAPAVILLSANLSDRENLLISLMQRRGNLTLARSPLYTENTRVIDPPIIPEKPVKPRKVINIAIGTLIGLMLSTFWALKLGSLDSRKAKQKEI